MLTTIQGRYHHGVIQLDELPPNLSESRVIVTFLVDQPVTTKSKRPLGLAPDRGQPLPAEFNAPLPDDVMAVFQGQGE